MTRIGRKLATERNGYAAVDVAAAGCWRDLRTEHQVWTQVDVDNVCLTFLVPPTNCPRPRTQAYAHQNRDRALEEAKGPADRSRDRATPCTNRDGGI